MTQSAATDFSTMPAIKSIGGPSPFSEAVGDAVTSGFGSILSAPSKAVDKFKYSDDGLRVVLHNKLALTRTAFQRAQSVLGRLLNRLTHEEEPFYVEFSGTHLKQVFRAGAINVPEQITEGGRYLLRRDIVVACKDQLEAQA